MKFNIGSSSYAIQPQSTDLPPDHPPIPSSSSSSSRRPPASCPMHSADGSSSSSSPMPGYLSSRTQKSSGAAKCPIQHDSSSSASSLQALNPLNSIPKDLGVDRQPGQKMALPLDREASTIPRPKPKAPEEDDGGGDVWEYPSPQQFYNALAKKGWETPEDSIEMIVAIHNFLNEKAWEEVMKWERRLPGGEEAQLERFQGKPGELSPKARMHLWAGKIFPSKFNTEPPFDRHDWIVTRPAPETKTTTTRYVIDYYSAPPDEDGNPVFSLDVRPALDDLASINQRMRMAFEEWTSKN